MKKIEISREHYEAIIKALEISGSVYGTISDFCNDDFKKDLVQGEAFAQADAWYEGRREHPQVCASLRY